jgi:hypothetical protein
MKKSTNRSDRLLVGCVWGGATLLAVWLGEGEERRFDLFLFAGALISAVAAGLVPLGFGWKAASATVAAFLFVLGFLLGQAELRHAFNSCVEKGETVREWLASEQRRTGTFPETLRPPQPLPGRRALRGPLLQYERTGSGYRLRFSDGVVTFAATESDAFLANK